MSSPSTNPNLKFLLSNGGTGTVGGIITDGEELAEADVADERAEAKLALIRMVSLTRSRASCDDVVNVCAADDRRRLIGAIDEYKRERGGVGDVSLRNRKFGI